MVRGWIQRSIGMVAPFLGDENSIKHFKDLGQCNVIAMFVTMTIVLSPFGTEILKFRFQSQILQEIHMIRLQILPFLTSEQILQINPFRALCIGTDRDIVAQIGRVHRDLDPDGQVVDGTAGKCGRIGIGKHNLGQDLCRHNGTIGIGTGQFHAIWIVRGQYIVFVFVVQIQSQFVHLLLSIFGQNGITFWIPIVKHISTSMTCHHMNLFQNWFGLNTTRQPQDDQQTCDKEVEEEGFAPHPGSTAMRRTTTTERGGGQQQP